MLGDYKGLYTTYTTASISGGVTCNGSALSNDFSTLYVDYNECKFGLKLTT